MSGVDQILLTQSNKTSVFSAFHFLPPRSWKCHNTVIFAAVSELHEPLQTETLLNPIGSKKSDKTLIW